MEYVVGFNFTRENVILIQKNKPEWQKGKLNGVGGKMEPGETPLEAMRREYNEETGDWNVPKWEHFLTLDTTDGSTIYFFKAHSHFCCARTATDESIHWVELSRIESARLNLVPNLRWLIPLALSNEKGWFKYADTI